MAVKEDLVEKGEKAVRARKQGKKPPLKKPTIALKEDDELDIQHVVDAHLAGEAAASKAMAEAVKEMGEVEKAPDFPDVERWGNKGKLTIASPGNIIDDPCYIPEYVEADGFKRHIANHRVIDGQTVVLTSDSQRKFRWCHPSKINMHKRHGFRFASYKKLFSKTMLFEEGQGDTIKNGDVVLMEISLDGWERMRAEKKRLQSLLEGAYGSELFEAGAKYGAPTFKEDHKRGVREFYT